MIIDYKLSDGFSFVDFIILVKILIIDMASE
jgi:hypothetical protein